ncbi:phosphotransferase enzyme family protein [Nesterenkonia lutea]|uniref:Ser/Thr protein kinase RdoA (MazF antagonist) n=1 Tax=Nesterenkonia lutea TaxID=272919 RepID=A0ABR9JG63_9MICC|nr:phosphotransferase [Nesterenkonia lutea]MBE1524928.1 Ser/Thr protein kinase RdoA (MazF antagonist) [Nesterenkonia lutea]
MQLETAHELAGVALAEFGLAPESQISFVKYRENHVFRVDSPAGSSFALKLHRAGYRTDEEILTELRHISELRARGISVPEARSTRTGELYAVVSHGGHTRRVSVVGWIHDAEPSGDAGAAFAGEEAAAPEDFTAMGELLGRLHRVSESMEPLAGFQRGAWDADGLAGHAPLWGDPLALSTLAAEERALLEHAMKRLRADLTELGPEPGTYGMIHGDSTPENVLKTPTGLMLIDFDDFGTGWYLFDLVTALFFYTPGPQYQVLEQALLQGYEKERVLSDAERGAWDALMLGRALSYLGWAAERPGDEASLFIEHSVVPWVLRLARAYCDGAPAPYAADAESLKETTL